MFVAVLNFTYHLLQFLFIDCLTGIVLPSTVQANKNSGGGSGMCLQYVQKSGQQSSDLVLLQKSSQ